MKKTKVRIVGPACYEVSKVIKAHFEVEGEPQIFAEATSPKRAVSGYYVTIKRSKSIEQRKKEVLDWFASRIQKRRNEFAGFTGVFTIESREIEELVEKALEGSP